MGALLLVCCGKPAAPVRLLSEAGAAAMSDTCFMQRKCLLRLTLAVALLAALAAGSPAGAAATARPVLTTAQFLDDLRFDDSRLAWVQSGPSSVCSEGNTVYRYSFVTGARTRLTNPWCTITSTGYFGRLVLAGKRVLGPVPGRQPRADLVALDNGRSRTQDEAHPGGGRLRSGVLVPSEPRHRPRSDGRRRHDLPLLEP